MADFVDAYDTKTGKKLPYRVPESHIDHPVLGKRLSRLPSASVVRIKPAPAAPAAPARLPARSRQRPPIDPVTTTQTPATGDHEKE